MVGDLKDLVGKLGELTGGFAAGVLQHMRGQDHFVAVGNVGVDEVVQQRPFQSCAHASVHPVAGACQLHAPLVVDKTQVCAQVHMVLGLKVKGMLLPDVAQGLVIFLTAGQQVGVGQVGQTQHSGAVLGGQLLEKFGVRFVFRVQGHGGGLVLLNLCVQGGSLLTGLFCLLLHAEELAVFLGQLILLSGAGLRGGLQGADLYVQLQNPVYDSVAVYFLGFQSGLDSVGIFLDFLDV